MIEKVLQFVKENNMLKKKDKVVLGVSGGADSICLFFVMLRLKEIYELDLYVVHVNHGIRGLEANEDEEFVQNLCQSHGIHFTAVHKAVKDIAKEMSLSEEEAGRNIRYEAFYKECDSFKCRKIAIAHNMNDSAETILFNLFRGSGIRGLTGISQVRDFIIRPLLCVSREEIEAYLDQIGESFRTDRTNLLEEYTRNKIRLNLIPYVTKEINEKAMNHIVSAGKLLSETFIYIENRMLKCYNNTVCYNDIDNIYTVDVKLLSEEELIIQKELFRYLLSKLANGLKDIESKHIESLIELLQRQVGKKVDLPYHIEAIKQYEKIIVQKKEEKQIKKDIRITDMGNNGNDEGMKHNSEGSPKLPIEVPGTYFDAYHKWNLNFRLINYKKNLIIPRNGCTKWFDYDRIKNTVFLRTREEGDFIQIDQKGSRKKIKSLFIDNKIPRELRAEIPLLADGNHIIWVVGDRISEAYKVNEDTKRILIVEVDGGNYGRQD